MSNGTVRQPRWDKYEAAILLDGYLETIKENTPKHRVVRKVSKDLRQMAVNRGIAIDEVYRNENGISYQIQSLESAYVGHKLYVPATRLFVEIVELYKNDNPQYQKILKEARHMIEPASSHKDAFLAWASSRVIPRRQKWIETNLQKIELFGSSAGILQTSIFETVDLNVLDNILRAIKKNKIFKLRTGKLFQQVLDVFILYLNYCLMLQNEEGSSDELSQDHINLLSNIFVGYRVQHGKSEDVITEDLLQSVFGKNITIDHGTRQDAVVFDKTAVHHPAVG